jgi:chloramphenicol O-acetyltransferase type A
MVTPGQDPAATERSRGYEEVETMRLIDMRTWYRREHFTFFNALDHPHFSMCANVDATAFCSFVRSNGYSLTISMVYVIARSSNAIPEFRYRIRGDQVVEHDVVNPGFSVLVDDDLFSFCPVEYTEDFSEFARRAAESVASVRAQLDLGANSDRDDVLYMSPIPWVSFTSFSHPMQLHPADSIPRFAWGKHFEESGRVKMPLNVQGHHALMDGIHVGRFYEAVQDCLHRPEAVLGAV